MEKAECDMGQFRFGVHAKWLLKEARHHPSSLFSHSRKESVQHTAVDHHSQTEDFIRYEDLLGS